MGRVFGADPIQPSLDQRLAAVGSRQHGVVSRAQARQLGATKGIIQRRLAAGRWERLARDVFRLAGAPPSWRQALMVACLAWGDDVAASHRSAADLARLVGFEPGPVELTVPRQRNRTGPGLIHRNRLFSVDVTTIDGIPATTAARTLIDLASVCSPDAVEEALDDALRRRLVSISRLRWRLTEVGGEGGRAGISVIRSLLASRQDGAVPESVFETRLLRVLRGAGVPPPMLQHRIRDAAGHVAILDFAFPEERVAIEADGYRWHSGRARWRSDLARRNAIASLGWRVVHATWDDLHQRPESLIDSVLRALGIASVR